MRLVPFDDESQINIESNLKDIVIPTPIKQMSELDNEIQSILNSDLDENTKSKLYSDSLRKFNIIKQKYSQSDIKNKTPISLDIDSYIQPKQTFRQSSKIKRIKDLGKKSLKIIKPIVKTGVELAIKKKFPNRNKISLKNLLKPSQVKSFIEALANNNGPTWSEY